MTGFCNLITNKQLMGYKSSLLQLAFLMTRLSTLYKFRDKCPSVHSRMCVIDIGATVRLGVGVTYVRI